MDNSRDTNIFICYTLACLFFEAKRKGALIVRLKQKLWVSESIEIPVEAGNMIKRLFALGNDSLRISSGRFLCAKSRLFIAASLVAEFEASYRSNPSGGGDGRRPEMQTVR